MTNSNRTERNRINREFTPRVVRQASAGVLAAVRLIRDGSGTNRLYERRNGRGEVYWETHHRLVLKPGSDRIIVYLGKLGGAELQWIAECIERQDREASDATTVLRARTCEVQMLRRWRAELMRIARSQARTCGWRFRGYTLHRRVNMKNQDDSLDQQYDHIVGLARVLFQDRSIPSHEREKIFLGLLNMLRDVREGDESNLLMQLEVIQELNMAMLVAIAPAIVGSLQDVAGGRPFSKREARTVATLKSLESAIAKTGNSIRKLSRRSRGNS